MSEKPDLSVLLSMLSNNDDIKNKIPEGMLSSIMNSMNKEGTSSSGSSSNSPSDEMPDMETIIKLMNLIKSSKEDSPSKELLNALKPFLSDSRKGKVDKYINILGITKVLEMLNESGDRLL